MVESVRAETTIVVAFTSDELSAARIKDVAERERFTLKVIDGKADEDRGFRSPLEGEPTEGDDANLFDKLTSWDPVLLIFNIGDESLPWRHWLKMLKSSPATRRLPTLCYGPHTQENLLDEAKNLAADVAVSSKEFYSEMPGIIERYSRGEGDRNIEEYCLKPLPEEARIGVAAFNKGNFFDAHEHLEDAWRADQTPGRDFYQALIQISVAYLQIERANYRGAHKMLLRSRQWFRGLPAVCRGIDVISLRRDARAVYESLLELGPERITEFDRSLLRNLRIVDGR